MRFLTSVLFLLCWVAVVRDGVCRNCGPWLERLDKFPTYELGFVELGSLYNHVQSIENFDYFKIA